MASGKSALRRRLLAARRAAGPRPAEADRLAAALLSAPPVRAARRVAAYVPVGGEPGPADLPDRLRAAGHSVLLPVVETDGALHWAAYDGELVDGPWGLRQPPGATAELDVDLVVAPALAVDRLGNRLGRGGGYYDRALAQLAVGVPVVCLVWDEEFLDAVPVEPHDRPVSAVVTADHGWLALPLRAL